MCTLQNTINATVQDTMYGALHNVFDKNENLYLYQYLVFLHSAKYNECRFAQHDTMHCNAQCIAQSILYFAFCTLQHTVKTLYNAQCIVDVQRTGT